MDEKRCGAKLRKKNESCRNLILQPNGRCRLHGGNTPNGIAAANFRHGRYSKYLPAKLQGKYDSALDDWELTTVRPDLALMDVYIAEKLERLRRGESQKWWDDQRSRLKRLAIAAQAYRDGRVEFSEQLQVLREMEDALQVGQEGFNSFEEIQPLIEQRRKLIETEYRAANVLSNYMSKDDVYKSLNTMIAVLRRNIDDRKVFQAIWDDLNRLMAEL